LGQVSRLDPFTWYDPDDPNALILESVWTDGASDDRGVAVTWTDDHVWVANSGGGNISRLWNVEGQWTRTVLDLQDPPYNPEFPSGVAVDSAGKLWVTCRGTDYVRRIDPALAGGLGDVDVDVYLGDGAWPYNYSDMTGYVALGALKQALWDDVYDSTVAGARWSRIDWNQETCPQPEGTSIRVQARAAESEAEVTQERFRDVSNGRPIFPALTGQYIEVRVILTGHGYDTAFESPMLCDLTLNRDYGQWADCDTNGIPDACEFDDCNENCVPDEDDIAFGWSDDCQPNGVPDECDPDCDADGLPDDCTIRQCTGDPSCSDCNRNGIPDGCDIAHETSTDCDGDGVPDECSGDCNRNLVWDACDILTGNSEDCQPNGIPDECELRSGASTDHNTNGVPDDCEDCNENGLPDACDLDCGAGNCPSWPPCGQFTEDCNNNGILDVCDVDCNANGVPDDCDSCDEFAGDADRDCDSDLLDFAAFQRCYNRNPLAGVCACEMDMDTNGAVVVSDYVAFENGFTGPGSAEPEPLGDGLGGGGESCGAFAAGPESGPEEPEPAEPPATNATIELRPVGGGAAVTTRTANTTYEGHYATDDLTAVNYVAMFGVTDSAEKGLSAAAQATSGDWADAQWFEFRYTEIEGVELVQNGWMPPAFVRHQVVASDFLDAAAEDAEEDAPLAAGPSGLLCTITTGEAGQMYLEVYLSLLDPAADSCEDAYGLVHFDVTP